MRPARPLALTMGDPAGIGGEITLKAWKLGPAAVPPFCIIDSAERLRKVARDLDWDIPIRSIEDASEALAIFPHALPVLDMPVPEVILGVASSAHGAAVRRAIDIGVSLVTKGAASALVTNPIHKASMYGAGFTFPGHTEYLEHLVGGTAIMMLACPGLRVVPVTIHLSLQEAIRQLTVARIVTAGTVLAHALRVDFGIATPRIAVAGLNPHAGEAGALGREDIEIVALAIKVLQDAGIAAFGPMPPDTMFHAAARQGYDAALCMYHDQALIPIKTIDFEHGVNVTLGLPIVRTSPDHGTAHDIAGTGRARESSLVEALRLADDMARHRAAA
jgi:4-hydroxythreonine-4-phosphate dehydrogenase